MNREKIKFIIEIMNIFNEVTKMNLKNPQYLQETDVEFRTGVYEIQQKIMADFLLTKYIRSDVVMDIVKAAIRHKDIIIKEIENMRTTSQVVAVEEVTET